MIAPKVFSPNDEIQYLNHTDPRASVSFIRRFLHPNFQKLFKNALNKYNMTQTGYDKEADVEFLSGCFLIISRESLNKVNGFDERFKLYFEDADICRSIRYMGYRSVFFPDAKFHHHWGRGQYKKFKLTFLFIQSMIRYFNKWGWKL